MKERPILFNAEMARAILDGRKTQTRRIVKPQPTKLGDRTMFGGAMILDEATMGTSFCPFGAPGDRLWVRETWRPQRDNQCERITYAADDTIAFASEVPDSWRRPAAAARGNVPSIHMPRWASRLTLEVTGVRAERLNDISEADAMAEGMGTFFETYPSVGIDQRITTGELAAMRPYGASFAVLWDTVNEGGPAWRSNPWVWVVEFKKVTP